MNFSFYAHYTMCLKVQGCLLTCFVGMLAMVEYNIEVLFVITGTVLVGDSVSRRYLEGVGAWLS